jgi:hypothetical protein
MRPFPQRLATPAPIGTLFKQSERMVRAAAVGEIADDDYLDAIRQLPCLKCGLEPCGEAAHVRLNSAAFNKRQAMARRPQPKWTAPLCRGCHTRDRDALHRTGEFMFWRQLGVNPLLVCVKLHAARGDLVRMRAVALSAIAERGGDDGPNNNGGGSRG